MDHRILLYPEANERARYELIPEWERLVDAGLIGTPARFTPEQRARADATDALFRARAARFRAEARR